MKKFAYICLLLATLTAISLQLIYRSHLPESVASQFGANGQPSNFMSRDKFILLMLALNAGLPLAMAGLAAGLKYLPTSLINIPNREYWFHPDRRASTLHDSEVMLVWISFVTSLFMLGLGHLTYLANANGQPLSMPFANALLIVYLLVIAAFCARSFIRYRLPQ